MATSQKYRRLVGFLAIVPVVLFAVLAGHIAPVSAAGTVAWSVQAQAGPSTFAKGDTTRCEETVSECDAFLVAVQNVGGATSTEPVVVRDRLPAGMTTLTTPRSNGEWECTEGGGNEEVLCTWYEPVQARSYAPSLRIYVHPPSEATASIGHNEVTAEGGGAASPAVRDTEVPINEGPPVFGVNELEFEPTAEAGGPDLAAGAHPWSLTAGFFVPTVHQPIGSKGSSDSAVGPYRPVRNIKTVSFELPGGFAGNPQSVETCTEAELDSNPIACPAGSKVGTVGVVGGADEVGELGVTGEECCSAVYNIAPQGGYPAMFGFQFAHSVPVVMYASVVRAPSGIPGVPPGYRLRVVAPGIPNELEVSGAVLTLFGESVKLDGSGRPE